MSDKINKNALNGLLADLSAQTGQKSADVKSNLQSGNIDNLLKMVNASDAERIKKALSSKSETEKILNSEQAREIMRQLFGDGKNG